MDGRERKRAEIIRTLQRAGKCQCDDPELVSIHGGDGELVLQITPDDLVMVIQWLIDENRKLRTNQRGHGRHGA